MNIEHIGNGGTRAHYGDSCHINEHTTILWPMCKETPKPTNRTRFRETERDVNCKNCLALTAAEDQELLVEELPEMEDGAIAENVMVGVVERKTVPENFLYMAQHADTATAREWWARKCVQLAGV